MAALKKQLEESKKELSELRVRQHSNSANARVSKIGNVRKDIARTLTVMNQEAKNSMRKHYASKGDKMPLDLRSKKTRAMRRRLTPAQAAKKTVTGNSSLPKRNIQTADGPTWGNREDVEKSENQFKNVIP